MRSVTVRLDDLRTTVLNLGFVGENEHTQIRIDSKKMYDQYPTASASLTVCPPEGESYPAVIERDGDFVLWTITDSDLVHEGNGEIQLSFTVSEVVAKTYIGRFKVSRSIIATGEIPEGIDDFLTRAGAALTAIPETIDEALAEAKASGEFDGPAGPAGQDGHDGQDGQDGFSPTATVTKSGKVATITITDKNGTTTETVSDGEGGDPTSIIDDTAGSGDTDKVWSADKSANTAQSLLSEINKRPELKATAEEEPDLDIVDTNGNALARFIDGGFIVKQFDGRKYSTYSVTGSFTRTALSLTINHPFKKGQKVVLHVEYGAKPWDYGAPVKYYEGNKMVADIYKGDSAYYEHIVTSDCNSISAVYESSAFSRTLDLTFEVSVLGDIQIEPTVLTIKTDGTGDYTNLKDCLAAIGTTANDVLNPYRIEIYPGTYNVLSDYTTEEISNIHDDDDPSSPSVQEGFVGPKLLNGMSLVGIGDPSEIVLNGYLDTTTWTSKYRNQISTLNLQGTSSIENLTVIATNLRYCVHDDWQFNGAKHLKRMAKNCVFRGYNIAYAPYTTYGAGCPISAGYYEFIDCDFGENAGLHASAIQHDRLQCRLVHCKGHGFRIGDSSISLTTMPGYSTYTFVDCDFKWIWSSSPDSEARAKVMGMCGQNVLYDLPSGMLYNTGDTVIDPRTDLSVGDVVEWYADTDHGFKWRTATSADKAHGVVVYEDSTDTYIQTSGYVRTDRVGITSFNLGDYVGLSSGSMVVINSATDAIGRIVYVNNDGDGFIKLDWRE